MLQCLVSVLTNIHKTFLLQFPKTELLNEALNSQNVDFHLNLLTILLDSVSVFLKAVEFTIAVISSKIYTCICKRHRYASDTN